MGIKNLFVTSVCSSFLLIASCAQVPKVNFRNQNPKALSESDQGANPDSGSDEDSASESIVFDTKDENLEYRPKLAIVLGPGASRTFAHVGVLKELKSSNIRIHSVLGMGWGALVAAEFVDQKSVHGLEWKVSRSETLKKLSETSFWSSKIKEKTTKDAESLIRSLLTDYGSNSGRRGEFTCPLLSKKKNALIFSDKRGLKNCIAVPPLFNPGKFYAPYLFDLETLVSGLKKMGAEKVILIDVLDKNPNLFGEAEESVTGAVYWYWNFVTQMTSSSHKVFDKVIRVDVESDILDFNDSLNSVRRGQDAGSDLVDYLKRKYQY